MRWQDNYVISGPGGAGCWVWQRALSDRGYGVVKVGGRLQYVHRLAYESVNGPIAAGLQLDHLCRNRACCNPAHLEAVSQGENLRRGTALITSCRRGHPFDKANTAYRTGTGARQCRACARDRMRGRRAK